MIKQIIISSNTIERIMEKPEPETQEEIRLKEVGGKTLLPALSIYSNEIVIYYPFEEAIERVEQIIETIRDRKRSKGVSLKGKVNYGYRISISHIKSKNRIAFYQYNPQTKKQKQITSFYIEGNQGLDKLKQALDRYNHLINLYRR